LNIEENGIETNKENGIETDKGKCPLCLGAVDVNHIVENTGKDKACKRM
jgi:hypothetical protein